MQVLLNATVLRSSLTMYVAATKAGELFSVNICVSSVQREACLLGLNEMSTNAVGWVHYNSPTVSYFLTTELANVVESRLEF